MSEKIYLLYRDFKAFWNSILFIICRIAPIKSNKIVFCALEGQSGFSCNPRYVALELLRRKTNYELIWLVNNESKEFPANIKKVKNTAWNRAYHLTTAKVWIDNSRKPYGTLKRKGQLYIQTWHATLGFKPAGKLRNDFPEIARRISENDSQMADYFLSNSKWCDDIYSQLLLTCDNTIRLGSPRCDILVQNRDKWYQKLRKKYQLPPDSKIFLYAPTFRGGSQKGVRKIFAETISLDLERQINNLKKKWPGTWYMFIRLHPQLAALSLEAIHQPDKNIYDVSAADDMNEIIAGCDVFITDYSSAAFDASFAGIPVFLYADDMDMYQNDRGKLLWDLRELPFGMASNNDDLERNILDFNPKVYQEKLNQLFQEVELIEDGYASQRVADLIDQFISGNKKSKDK